VRGARHPARSVRTAAVRLLGGVLGHRMSLLCLCTEHGKGVTTESVRVDNGGRATLAVITDKGSATSRISPNHRAKFGVRELLG